MIGLVLELAIELGGIYILEAERDKRTNLFSNQRFGTQLGIVFSVFSNPRLEVRQPVAEASALGDIERRRRFDEIERITNEIEALERDQVDDLERSYISRRQLSAADKQCIEALRRGQAINMRLRRSELEEGRHREFGLLRD